jgi:hypothetical protein
MSLLSNWALGKDSIPFEFFQKLWPKVGQDVYAFTVDIFSSQDLPVYLNSGLITLISKTE